jgi:hypothetical protein
MVHLSYSPTSWCPRRKRHVCAALALPALYVTTYVLLRACGVFYPFYNQGGWEIDCSTRISAVDVFFLPAASAEEDLQNRLRWHEEPRGA